ncbi:hypothetical protein [Mycetocola saprophilus]|uniref:hypothetical protein n=1 Tax=Mycetocola saprophilus TaxID=76636 RepID=UPI0012DD6E59|nr:hypothetical protein [Mycetocola saprophilus]
MMFGIDLTISGDPNSIRTVATWTDEKLRGSEDLLRSVLNDAEQSSSYAWRGESGNAFREAVKQVHDRISDIDDYSKRAAIVLRAYAFRLENGIERFLELAALARESGLRAIDGSLIYPPVNPSPTNCSVNPPSNVYSADELSTIAEYQEMLDSYTRTASTVQDWREDQVRWYHEHVVPLLNEIEDLVGVDQLLDGLKAANELLMSNIIETITQRNDRALAGLQKEYVDFKAEIDGVWAARKSGNPSIRSPASEFDIEKARDNLDEIGLARSKTIQVGNFLKLGGAAVSLVSTGIEIANGEDLGIAGAGLLGGYVGGLAGASLAAGLGALTGVTIPIWFTVGAVVAAGAGGTAAATSIYTGVVPLDRREELDIQVPHAIANTSTVPGSWVPRFIF